MGRRNFVVGLLLDAANESASGYAMLVCLGRPVVEGGWHAIE